MIWLYTKIYLKYFTWAVFQFKIGLKAIVTQHDDDDDTQTDNRLQQEARPAGSPDLTRKPRDNRSSSFWTKVYLFNRIEKSNTNNKSFCSVQQRFQTHRRKKCDSKK